MFNIDAVREGLRGTDYYICPSEKSYSYGLWSYQKRRRLNCCEAVQVLNRLGHYRLIPYFERYL